MSDLYVSWTDYHSDIERLAKTIHESGWAFDQIICIARGGLRIGDVLSRIWDAPLAIISTSSYVEHAGTVRGEIAISTHLAMTTPNLGRRVLLVDDLVDSGVTLDVVLRDLAKRYPDISEIRTAVLWWKACSKFKPDYFVKYLADNPWIHQPFERYDQVKPAEVAASVR